VCVYVCVRLCVGNAVRHERALWSGIYRPRLSEVTRTVPPLAVLPTQVIGAGATSGGSMDAANLMKPLLARGLLRCIGATTLAEYRKHIEKDAAFERRFAKVVVAEPSVPATISILRGLKER
jgi:hypothetical protein